MYTVTYRVLTVWTRHHFGPARRQWFLVNVDSPWEMKQNVRISRKRLQLLLDRITLGFSLLIPFKDFKCYGERGGEGAPDFKLRGWLKDFWGVEIFDSGIFLVSISFTWEFFAFSLMKQKKFSGVSGVSFFFWGGGLIFGPIRSFCHLKSGVAPPPPRAWELGAKKRVATFTIAQLAFAHVRQ